MKLELSLLGVVLNFVSTIVILPFSIDSTISDIWPVKLIP